MTVKAPSYPYPERVSYIVIYGTLEDGFQFYGPFENEQHAEEFIGHIGLTRDACTIKLIDIPTH